jgi:hypothetical protein
MTDPLQLTFRGMTPSPALEASIRRKAAKLARIAEGHLLGCHVTLTLDSHKPHPRAPEAVYHATVELHVRGGDRVVGREHRTASAENAYVAVRDAFRAARRLVEHRFERSRSLRRRPERAAPVGVAP